MDKSKTEQKKTRVISIKLDAVELPVFAEKRNSDWVFAGERNNYFNFLLDLYNTANIHNSILENKSKYVFGEGAELINKTQPSQRRYIGNIPVNDDEEKFNTLLRKIILDYEIYNGMAIEVVYNATFTEIAEIRHVDFTKVRTNTDETQFAYADHWVTQRGYPIAKGKLETPENGWTVYNTFNPETAQQDGGIQLYYFKEYRPSIDYYPLPGYIGAIQYVVAEKKIANYQVNNIDNNFWNNFIVHFRDGEPTEAEKKELTEMFKARHVGTDAKEKVLFTFSDPGVEPPSVDSLDANNSAEVFEYLSADLEKQLFIGHGVTSPMLFGAKTAGQLGARNEMIEANELYQNRYVNHRQHQVEGVLNDIFSVNDDENLIRLRTIQPMSYDVFSSPDMLAVLSAQEKRRILADKYNIELDDATPVQMKAVNPDWSDEEANSALDYLMTNGEEDDEEWVLVYEGKVDDDLEDEDIMRVLEEVSSQLNFAEVIDAKPDKRSWSQDNFLWRIRYQYKGRATARSREFCQKMVSANLLYRKEDIVKASRQPVNPGFGPRGRDTYNLWYYKGGGNCHHWWSRRIFMRINNKEIGTRQAREIINTALRLKLFPPSIKIPVGNTGYSIDIKTRDLAIPVNDKRVVTRPVDMPNNGFLRPRGRNRKRRR